MAEEKPILPYEPGAARRLLPASHFFIAAAAVAGVGLVLCAKALVSVAMVPRGSVFRPYESLNLILLGGGASAIFGSIIALAGLLAGDRGPNTRRQGLLTLLLTLGVGIAAPAIWRAIIAARDLKWPP